MNIATYANTRTANGVRDGLNKGLKIAFASGSVMGLTVVGLGLFDISVWFILLKFVFKLNINDVMTAMLTFGMGASSMALFARVGGGIFTKAADVGADLVGKVEVGIPEDDPRNPACIADNVGDNVGDVAGMGADLYESVCRLDYFVRSACIGGRGLALTGTCADAYRRNRHNCVYYRHIFRFDKGRCNAKIAFRLIKTRYIHCVNSVGSRLGIFIFTLLPDNSKCNLGGYFGTYRRRDDRIFHRALHVRLLQSYKNLAKSSNTGSATIIIDRYRTGNVVNGDTCYYNRNFGNYKPLYRRRYGKL